MPRHPFKIDPSRTALIRRSWVADMSRRFEAFRKTVWKHLQSAEVLGSVTTNAPYKFATDDAKVRIFNRWLKRQIDEGILDVSPVTGEPRGMKPWMHKYIDSAYRQGLVRSYIEVHKKELGKKPAFYEGTKAEFLRSSFSRPERTDKLKLLYTRSYEDLKGVTAAMSSQLSRTLTDGLAHGQNPMKIARTISKQIKFISKQRARVIARTETIHAHAEGQLDGMEDLGIEEVSGEVEFGTADDDGVCVKCENLSGNVYTIKKARGIIPVHPNCRCAWLPVIKIPGKKGK